MVVGLKDNIAAEWSALCARCLTPSRTPRRGAFFSNIFVSGLRSFGADTVADAHAALLGHEYQFLQRSI